MKAPLETTVSPFGGSIADVVPSPPNDGASSLKAESIALMDKWNQTAAPYPLNGRVHDFFEEQTKRTPDAIAVISGEIKTTYRELAERAAKLAAHLRTLGVGPDSRVGLSVERSLDMMVGVLGILKAGGAYVPMDPAYPQERLAFMLEDSRAPVLLTQKKFAAHLSSTKAKVIFLDEPLPKESPSSKFSTAEPTPEHLAYVIYTSGSTGRPKGVAMVHRCLVNLVAWQLTESKLPPGAKTLQFASLSFDVSFQEMFSTWAAGGALVLITEELRRHPEGLLRLMQQESVARLFLPFVALQQIAQAVEDTGLVPETLREVITAGEQLQISRAIENLFEKLPQTKLFNHYGPSESHVVTSFPLNGPPSQWMRLPPIGRPVANCKIFLLDPNLQPVEIGEPGELHIGGVSLARGYLDRPELTQQKFIADPFSREPGARLYKTGDLAKFLPDGNIEFLGRIDHQVKIRGFRIELGEIETVLGQHPKVREATVSVYEPAPGDKRLVGYFVPQSGEKPSVGELRFFLGEKLADYMVPTMFMALEKLPLTPSGKVDRRSLPAPDQSRPDLEKEFAAPRNETENQLTKLWEKLLNVQPVGIHDNFFDLGGDSLIASRLFTQIQKNFGKNFVPTALLGAPTIGQLAGLITGAAAASKWTSLIPIQPNGTRPPLFCMHAGAGTILFYYDLANRLGDDQPVYGLQAQGLYGGAVPHEHVEEMAAHYIQEMRSVQPHGPYQLAGFCFGAIVAFEVAQQLRRAGEQICFLASFDGGVPRYDYREGRAPKGATALEDAALNRPAQPWLIRHLRNLAKRSPRKAWRYVQRKVMMRLHYKRLKYYYVLGRYYSRKGKPLPDNLRRLFFLQNHFRAEKNYQLQTFPGKMTIYVSAGLFAEPDLGWTKWALGGVEVVEIPGEHKEHRDIMTGEFIDVAAAHLKTHLARAR
ncbi:MAG: amino acid adenylation domain-containing protein [Verrucomicrobia bacterium]|nr:amino acid adenylation domain-containing protein [Verrucomicrobiota bacterium]